MLVSGFVNRSCSDSLIFTFMDNWVLWSRRQVEAHATECGVIFRHLFGFKLGTLTNAYIEGIRPECLGR